MEQNVATEDLPLKVLKNVIKEIVVLETIKEEVSVYIYKTRDCKLKPYIIYC